MKNNSSNVKGDWLNDIVKIERIDGKRTDIINAHLSKGWIIIAKDSEEFGADSVMVKYHLGWPSTKGAIQEVTIDDYDVKPDYSAPKGWNKHPQ